MRYAIVWCVTAFEWPALPNQQRESCSNDQRVDWLMREVVGWSGCRQIGSRSLKPRMPQNVLVAMALTWSAQGSNEDLRWQTIGKPKYSKKACGSESVDHSKVLSEVKKERNQRALFVVKGIFGQKYCESDYWSELTRWFPKSKPSLYNQKKEGETLIYWLEFQFGIRMDSSIGRAALLHWIQSTWRLLHQRASVV